MTNPDRDELVKLADRLAFLSNVGFGYDIIDTDRSILRKSATALRRLASSDGGVTVRELEWREYPSGDCEADVYSTSNTYGQGPRKYALARGSAILGYFDEVDAAKAAAQADYEGRIKSALITAPPADAGMREALEDIEALGRHLRNGGPDPMDLQELSTALSDAVDFASGALLAEQALTASGATTKSDGGVEGHADFNVGRSPRASQTSRELGEAGIKPGPSDPSSTRSDVTVEFEYLADDFLAVVSEIRRQNWKNGGVHLYDDEEAARKVARALLDQFEIRRK